VQVYRRRHGGRDHTWRREAELRRGEAGQCLQGAGVQVDLQLGGAGGKDAAVRADAHERCAPLMSALRSLTHEPTWLAVHAERAVSRALGGSCSMPLAAFAHWSGDGVLRLDAALGGSEESALPLVRASVQAQVADVDAAQALGVQAAQALRDHGGDRLLATLGG